MKMLTAGVVMAATLISATVATAQTPSSASQSQSASAAAPSVNLWYLGVMTGVTFVDHSSGLIGAEAGARVWKNLDITGELGWMNDVVTTAQMQATAPIVTFLKTSQGDNPSATVKVPVLYSAVGARWVFEEVGGHVRPYAQFAIGGARVERQSTFILNGQDITSSLPQYGVTLGSDLTGTDSHLAVGGGVGVVIPYGMWYGSAGYHFLSIRIPSQATTVNEIRFSFGARF
jgi:hypothetical protein